MLTDPHGTPQNETPGLGDGIGADQTTPRYATDICSNGKKMVNPMVKRRLLEKFLNQSI
ncbi:hypothetical protein MUP59_09635 [Candidatus Bathyarchaeota archaeon]|nr:hypothetical protein [Candidatus Bathyarchaeota archaeon]